MPTIKIFPHEELCPNGATINVNHGENICQALLHNNIKIEHACDMSCACTTCHVIIKNGGLSLRQATDQEDDLLDMAWGLTSTSRLSCQAIIGNEDIEIVIPKYSINHAKE